MKYSSDDNGISARKGFVDVSIKLCRDIKLDELMRRANRFVSFGVNLLRVVDLDGQKCGYPVNLRKLIQFMQLIDLPIEFQGGIKNYHDARVLLEIGVERVIVEISEGQDLMFVEKLVSEFGDDCVWLKKI